MSIRRPSNASNSVTAPRSPMSGVDPFTSTMGSRRRAAAMASPSLVWAFSRTRNASSAAWKVLRSTIVGAPSSSLIVYFTVRLHRPVIQVIIAPSIRLEFSALVVLIVAAPPDAGLVASAWRVVEPLEHAPEGVEPVPSARISGIGVVGDAVLERERAHARPLARVSRRVGSGHGRELGDGLQGRSGVHRVATGSVVVIGDCLALLLLGERRAGRTPRRVGGPEHEVVDEELRAPSKEIRYQRASLVGIESVRLIDADPWQLLASSRQIVGTVR